MKKITVTINDDGSLDIETENGKTVSRPDSEDIAGAIDEAIAASEEGDTEEEAPDDMEDMSEGDRENMKGYMDENMPTMKKKMRGMMKGAM